MGGDISDGAKIALGLVLLVAIVAIVMQLLKMVKNQSNSGSVALQDSFAKVSESEFDGYDQVTKTGVDVASAVKIFDGRPVAIVVQTNKQVATKDAWLYNCLLAGTTVTDGGSGRGNMVAVKTSDTAAAAYTTGTIAPWADHNGYLAELEVDAATGAYKYNTNTKPMSATSTDSAVRDSGTFLAQLIKNDAGENIGVYFMQTK